MRVQVTVDVAPDVSSDRIIGSGSSTVAVEFVGVHEIEEVAKRAAQGVIESLKQRTT
jgi:hypothetical protein